MSRDEVHRVDLDDEGTRRQSGKAVVTGIAAAGIGGGGGVILVDARGEGTAAVSVLVEVDPYIIDARLAAKGFVDTVVIGIQPYPLAQAGCAGRQDDPGIPGGIILARDQAECCCLPGSCVGIGVGLVVAADIRQGKCRPGRL